MSKTARGYLGLLSAVISYYVIHEGAHLVYALYLGVFKQIRFMGIGMQIEAYTEKMSDTQLGIFCIVGAIATLITGVILVAVTGQICKIKSKVFRACMYYITITMLMLDPLYLSVLCGFFGGGDMNGIKLLMPEGFARVGFGVLFIAGIFVFRKLVLPKYQAVFVEDSCEK